MKKHLKIIINIITIIVILFCAYVVLGTFVTRDKYKPEKEHISTELKNSHWISVVDTLSIIEIKNGKWMFVNEGMVNNKSFVYEIEITSDLPKFIDRMLYPNKFLILTNETNTLYYEIMGFDNKLMSLRHFPSGKILIYKSK